MYVWSSHIASRVRTGCNRRESSRVIRTSDDRPTFLYTTKIGQKEETQRLSLPLKNELSKREAIAKFILAPLNKDGPSQTNPEQILGVVHYRS